MVNSTQTRLHIKTYTNPECLNQLWYRRSSEWSTTLSWDSCSASFSMSVAYNCFCSATIQCPMVLTNSGLAQNCTSKSKPMSSCALSPVTGGNVHDSGWNVQFWSGTICTGYNIEGVQEYRQRKASTFWTLNANHAVPFPRGSWLLVSYATFWKDLIHEQESNAGLS